MIFAFGCKASVWDSNTKWHLLVAVGVFFSTHAQTSCLHVVQLWRIYTNSSIVATQSTDEPASPQAGSKKELQQSTARTVSEKELRCRQEPVA